MKIFNIAFKVVLVLAIGVSAYLYLTVNRYQYGNAGPRQTRTHIFTGEVYMLDYSNTRDNGKWEKMKPERSSSSFY
jgi:hypothetical protein